MILYISKLIGLKLNTLKKSFTARDMAVMGLYLGSNIPKVTYYLEVLIMEVLVEKIVGKT